MLEAHGVSPLLSSKAMSALRRRVMVARYRALPPQLVEKFVDTFSGDFALFGYDPKPDDIFKP